jgi:type IV secretory pathway VirB2 component (pilin)
MGGQFWPFVAMIAIVVTGLAYSFSWGELWYHVHAWVTPPDVWATFRDAHWVGWGSEGAIYGAKTNLVTFPGIAVLLTPLALLQGPLHLSSSFPIGLPKPTEWYVLGPVDLLLGGFVLFPLNVLAKRLAITARRRIGLIWLEAALVWPVVAVWGHPEDPVAVALAVYALVAVYDRKWLQAGFFLGLAVAFQPLVFLMVPVAFVLIPVRRWPILFGEIALPSAVLLLGPLLREWGPTTRALLKQPNYPQLNHPTPWLALAPKLSPSHYIKSFHFHEHTLANGTKIYSLKTGKTLTGTVVAAGPERDLALLLAIFIGFYLMRRRPSWPRLIWWLGVALSLRCVFESIIDPFYFFPGMALILVACFTTTWRKILLTTIFCTACTFLSYWHTGEWTYYVLVSSTLLLAISFAFPPVSKVQALAAITSPANDTKLGSRQHPLR